MKTIAKKEYCPVIEWMNSLQKHNVNEKYVSLKKLYLFKTNSNLNAIHINDYLLYADKYEKCLRSEANRDWGCEGGLKCLGCDDYFETEDYEWDD